MLWSTSSLGHNPWVTSFLGTMFWGRTTEIVHRSEATFLTALFRKSNTRTIFLFAFSASTIELHFNLDHCPRMQIFIVSPGSLTEFLILFQDRERTELPDNCICDASLWRRSIWRQSIWLWSRGWVLPICVWLNVALVNDRVIYLKLTTNRVLSRHSAVGWLPNVANFTPSQWQTF